MLNPVLGEAFGTERVLADSTAILRRAGHKVFLLGDEVRGQVPDSDGYHLIPGLHGARLLMWPTRVRRLMDLAFAQIEKFKPDVVHLLDQYDFRFMKELCDRYRVVMTAHLVSATCPASARLIPSGGGCEYPSGWSCLAHHQKQNCLWCFNGTRARTVAITELLLRRRSLKKAKAIFMISEYVRETFLRDGWPKEQLRLVYNPVEVTPVLPVKEVPNKLIFVAARLELYKGIDIFLEALKQIESEEWVAWIAGSGSREADFKELAVKLNLEKRVKFMGRLPYLQVRGLMAACRVFVQSNRGPEAFGLSVAEASAHGVPVVITDVSALDEMVEHGVSGFVEKDTAGVARAMKKLLNNEPLCARMGKAGAELIKKRFSAEIHLDQTMHAYRAVTGIGDETENELKKGSISAF